MSLDTKFDFRISTADKDQFEKLCKSKGVHPANLMREFIQTFNRGDLRLLVKDDSQPMIKGVHECR